MMNRPHSKPQRRSSLRTRRLLVASAATAAAAWSAACAAPAPPPDPEAPPSPVYTWEAASDAGSSAAVVRELVVENETAAALSHWRFVPLGTATKPFPTQAEFTDLATRCSAATKPEDAAASLRACLGDRGFYEAECSDGRDNDGDGLVDHAADPGCAEAHALSEAPECNDKRDNDGDGLADWDGAGFTHPDPECADSPTGRREAPPRRRGGLNPF